MILENTGNVYELKLQFEKGKAYAVLLDYTDISPFDGIMVCVFDSKDLDIDNKNKFIKLKSSKYIFGPVSISAYPPSNGRNGWKLIGKTDTVIIKGRPSFKENSLMLTHSDWSMLERWNVIEFHSDTLGCFDYEQIRHLETRILNSTTGVIKKLTMMRIINSGEDVSKYYDLKDRGNINMLEQLVNTYYSIETARFWISVIDKMREAK